MPLAFPITRSQVAAPGLLDFGAQQIVQRDDAQDFPAVVIHQGDEVAGGFDQQPLQLADRLVRQAGRDTFHFGGAVFSQGRLGFTARENARQLVLLHHGETLIGMRLQEVLQFGWGQVVDNHRPEIRATVLLIDQAPHG